MLYSTKIGPNLYQVAQVLPEIIKPTAVRERAHRLVVVDASGSTYSFNRDMMREAKNEVDRMPEGDLFSLAYFSSVGDFDWIIKGMEVGANRDGIKRIIDNFQPPFNMTCFAEVLADVESVVETLAPVCDNFYFLFMTDGNDNQKRGPVIEILKRLAQRFRISTILGWGPYYDRQRLADLAAAIGGSFVHANNVRDWREHLQTFNDSVGTAEPKIEVKLEAGALYETVYTLTGNGVQTIEAKDANMLEAVGRVLRNPTLLVSKEAEAIYFYSDHPVGQELRGFGGPVPTACAYGGAVMLSQLGKANDATAVMGNLGDIRFVRRLNNAYTILEYGKIEVDMARAVYNEAERFVEGFQPGCVPDPSAVCVLDVLERLTNNPTVSFLPWHPEFKETYSYVGRRTKRQDGYPKFEAPSNVKAAFNSTTWGKEKLNVGGRFKISGTIPLPAEATTYGLPRVLDVFLWREYTFISDGNLNAPRMALADVDDELMTFFNENGLVVSNIDGTVVIDLTGLPVINRTIAERYRDPRPICDLVMRETRLEGENLVVGHLFKQYPEEVQERVKNLVSGVTWSDIQMAFLATLGVGRDGAFNPPSEKLPATDELFITTVAFDVDGISSLPEIKDIVKKLNPPAEDATKKTRKKKGADEFTPRQAIVADPYRVWTARIAVMSDAKAALELREARKDIEKQLRAVRKEINMARFGGIVGKAFEKLGEETPVEHNGVTCLIKIKRNVRVEI